ncbi:MAG: type II toxin-antitoxin system PemK/MazF family toxin [Rubrivivax sp.]|nr:type II toxin-antitoxin system PemK/MazF family toxin [Pyrinomonadaceae bacterium]
MNEGDVILTPVPQADGVLKNRPAVVLRELPLYRDLLVCGVSTQLRQQVKDFDEIISPADVDFASSGLLAESLIRLGFLAVLPRKSIVGSIGVISKESRERLLQTLSNYLEANISKTP